MYAQALSDYKNHLYKEARDKFTDIEDIAPGYKSTHIYLERIEGEIIQEQKRREKSGEDKQSNPIQPIDISRQKANSIVPPAPVAERQDVISSALDSYEAKPK